MKILVLGITGMLGSMVLKKLTKNIQHDVWGAARHASKLDCFPNESKQKIIIDTDLISQDTLITILGHVRPDVVINCIGLIKQHFTSEDPLKALTINSMLPHRLSELCKIMNARLIHISTDCVFSGRKGMYIESNTSDAEDLYGKSKYIGEIHHDTHTITLRTSIIGHELKTNLALIDWFLSQSDPVKGYTRAIFSGLPTVEMARVILDYVIPFPELNGLFHLSVDPIDKNSLLRLVADIYKKEIEIIPDEQICINRSLDSNRFRRATGYKPPSWPELVKAMYNER
jgi:dTDP-4-dehydrorhamnose reductase